MGERIRAAREALGLSQEKFARQLGIDPTTIRRWELGQGKPSQKLSEVLNNIFDFKFKRA